MQVVVEYLAQIKRAAGTPREMVELPSASTLGQLLAMLGDRHDAAFRDMLLDSQGKPRRMLLFFVAEQSVDASHTLKDGDVVSILAPMAGG
ncbi:MAG: MoaD/ThiS family protein [Gemmataceae bacterium]|nr:MoaD/ThiS family protein [Gemmataceae bacterium]